jgi:hypothetical protein
MPAATFDQLTANVITLYPTADLVSKQLWKDKTGADACPVFWLDDGLLVPCPHNCGHIIQNRIQEGQIVGNMNRHIQLKHGKRAKKVQSVRAPGDRRCVNPTPKPRDAVSVAVRRSTRGVAKVEEEEEPSEMEEELSVEVVSLEDQIRQLSYEASKDIAHVCLQNALFSTTNVDAVYHLAKALQHVLPIAFSDCEKTEALGRLMGTLCQRMDETTDTIYDGKDGVLKETADFLLLEESLVDLGVPTSSDSEPNGL